jgi:hypothetical protein
MNHKELDKKRLIPCVSELYQKAIGPTHDIYPQGYDTWREHPVWGFRHGGDKPVKYVPMDCYYIAEAEARAIVDKWCKGLHGFWYYMPKLDFHDSNYKARVKELHDFRNFEDVVSKDKTLTYAQRAAKIKKEALAHNFEWRSHDKEYIRHNIWLGVCPNSNKEWVTRNHAIYGIIVDAFNQGLIQNTYRDYTHMSRFEYIGEDNTVLTAVIENKNYYRDRNNNLICSEENREYCNLYNDNGEYVDYLWDYINICRNLSAKTFEVMYDQVKPIIESMIMEKAGDPIMDKLIEKIKSHRGIDDDDIKQCLAVFIMSRMYIEEQEK